MIRIFKTALDQMLTDNHKIVIKADKIPSNLHERLFNAPTINEVAIVISSVESQSRDIVLHKRCEGLQRIAETHRSYDALQYPLIFWDGQDSYDFNIQQINPLTKRSINSKVTSRQGFRIMIRDEENYLWRYKQLFHQFVVDVYAKIESERLTYLKLNQTRLRVEDYIHLRDAINNDGNAENLGQLLILPATFIGSPRHLHEYAQDALAYVAAYGRPDLFITFTCNPSWPEVADNLLSGQTFVDRHDLLARVFKQKLTRLINLLTKSAVFGEVQCHMYSIEWQKRGLPHSHILVWLKETIRPVQIDSIISAEIPDQAIDPGLHSIVMKNMIHGPCGVINPSSPCMKENRCTKKYPRHFLDQTISGKFPIIN